MALWSAQVNFMTGRRWEGPFAVTVEATSSSVAAHRAISCAVKRLKPRTRIREIRFSVQRQNNNVTS